MLFSEDRPDCNEEKMVIQGRCLEVLLSSCRPMRAQTKGRVCVDPSAGTHRLRPGIRR